MKAMPLSPRSVRDSLKVILVLHLVICGQVNAGEAKSCDPRVGDSQLLARTMPHQYPTFRISDSPRSQDGRDGESTTVIYWQPKESPVGRSRGACMGECALWGCALGGVLGFAMGYSVGLLGAQIGGGHTPGTDTAQRLALRSGLLIAGIGLAGGTLIGLGVSYVRCE